MLALSFAQSRSSDSELVGMRERDRQSCLFKERTHRDPQGKLFNATWMLIVGEHEGVFFSQRPVAQKPSIAAKDRVYVVVDLLKLNHQLQNGVAWAGSIFSPLFSLPAPIEHFHS